MVICAAVPFRWSFSTTCDYTHRYCSVPCPSLPLLEQQGSQSQTVRPAGWITRSVAHRRGRAEGRHRRQPNRTLCHFMFE